MSLRRERPAALRPLGSALSLLLAVLLALGPVRPAWAAIGAGLPAPVHQFTGVEPDPGTGLYHFGVRAYDPTLRRWLSADPLLANAPDKGVGSGEVLNLYGYANNNPVIAIDPEGKTPLAVAIAVGFVLAAPFVVKSEKDIPKATTSAVVGGVVSKGLSMAGRAALEKRIAEHESKLAEFLKNPTVRPGMEGQVKRRRSSKLLRTRESGT